MDYKFNDSRTPLELFHAGDSVRAYEFMGAHRVNWDNRDGVVFRVWAPNALSVSVVGNFNGWNNDANYMYKISEAGVWELFIEGIQQYDIYKYCVETPWNERQLKSDPYAFHSQTRPDNASMFYDLSGFEWEDDQWIKDKESSNHLEKPMNIYEIHAGSWRKYMDGSVFNYRKLAEELVPYVKEMGYTHVELMPITEYPFDGSWGYQVTGYYAPTSRYGTPHDCMAFVDECHKAGIGVILDWVPAHFPRDAHGLEEFDGGCVYEYADPKKGEHPEWGTKVFDFGKSEVKNFLIANALYWVEHFHIDGLRVDAVASILYLDYGRENGQWTPNIYGGNKNLEAIEFFKHLNSVVLGRNHGAMMIAEESTAWPKVTGKPEEDGLGFSHKWNMGWMNDFLEYMKLDPYFRKWNHNKMTFSMTYAYAEKYILVLSHDEVVHLKCSMINKMPGLYDDKFANLRAGYAYMLGHPGKKLLFMGQEFAQLQEWSEARELDWYLLAEDKHQQMQNYVKALLHLYKKTPALYDADQDPCGFEWINADDADRSIFSFVRHSKDGKSNLLFVINFTPVARPDYRVGVPKRKQYRLVLDGDAAEFGGNTTERPVVYKAVKSECDGREYSFAYDLPAYGIAIFKF